MHLVRKSLSFDKFVTATMRLVFPTPWPTIWALASDYSKKHDRTTRYIRPHLASASGRNKSDSWDIDVDEWGKNICKSFYFLAVVAVIPFPCYALASCILCKSGCVNVFFELLKESTSNLPHPKSALHRLQQYSVTSCGLLPCARHSLHNSRVCRLSL